jgi:hypothetical protein
LLLIGTLLSTVLPASAIRRWERYYNWDYNEQGRSIIQTPDSCLVVVGETTSYGPGVPDHNNFYMIKLDPSGEMIWRKTYGTDLEEAATAVDQSADGGFIIAGYHTISPTDDDFMAVRTDGAGNMIWTQKYGRPGWWDDCMSAQACRTGGYVFAGVTARYGTPGDVYVVRANSRGDIVWSMYWGASFADEKPYSIQETTDGGFIVGITKIMVGSVIRYICLLKLNAFGQIDWVQTYPGSSWCMSARQTDDGGYIIAGGVLPQGSYYGDIYVLKVNASGVQQWKVQWGGFNGSDCAYSACQMTDGSYVVGGITQADVLSHWKLFGMRIDRKGHVIWTRTYGGRYDEMGWAGTATMDGGAAFCGGENDWGPGAGIYVVKIDRDGNDHGLADPPMQPLRVSGMKPTFPNPFRAYVSIPGAEADRFVVYDVLGRQAGQYGGSRVGWDLPPGVYLMRKAGSNEPAVRIVKTN